MNDTPREIAQMVQKKLMARPGAERLMMGNGRFEAARAMILASFPAGQTSGWQGVLREQVRRFEKSNAALVAA